jgi:hypothetical protein
MDIIFINNEKELLLFLKSFSQMGCIKEHFQKLILSGRLTLNLHSKDPKFCQRTGGSEVAKTPITLLSIIAF